MVCLIENNIQNSYNANFLNVLLCNDFALVILLDYHGRFTLGTIY